MIKEFAHLNAVEQQLLLNAPVIVSLLAASTSGEIPEYEKADAISLAHIRTFSAPPLLIDYYKEVDKQFERNFELLAKKYMPFDKLMHERLEQEMEDVVKIINKLDARFALALRTSLTEFAKHVRNAYKGLIINFIFPFPIPGLTE